MEGKKRARLFSLKYLLFDFIKLSAAVPTLIWLRPKRRYSSEAARKKVRAGALVIANHTAFIDPIYVMTAFWYRRMRFIISEEIGASRAGGFFRACGGIVIDRKNPSIGSFKQITSSLGSGELVAIFPEGHISDQKGDAFKSGVTLMALKSGAPVVPVYIKPRKGFFDRLRVVFGEAVDVRELYGERPTFAQIGEATELLHNRMAELRNIE